MKQSLLKASETLVKVVPGLTEESVTQWKHSLEEPEHQLRIRVYFLVARKRYVRHPSVSLNLKSLICVCLRSFSYQVSLIQSTEVIRKGSALPIRLVRRLFGAFYPLYWARSLKGAASWFVSLSRWR